MSEPFTHTGGAVTLHIVERDPQPLTAAETRLAIALFTQLKNRQIKGFVPFLRRGEIRAVPVPMDAPELNANVG